MLETYSVVAIFMVSLSLASLSTTIVYALSTTKVDEQNGIDYTCDVRADYSNPKCPTIGDGKCDDPNRGGSTPSCTNQDCIDCDSKCKLDRLHKG